MCGICGFFGFNDNELLKRMTICLVHRGPNNKGFFEDKNVSLGFRRLSIIDLSTKGNQPFFNEDKSVAAVFNGEIYNFLELKRELEKKGHRFESNSDGETIVHLYEEFKEKFVEKLSGMFAIALWDLKKKKLFLARDRMGKKPLYYFQNGEAFLFASEIKSILQSREVQRKVNSSAIDFYLSMRCMPENETFFEGIKKVLPGEIVVVSNAGTTKSKFFEINMAQKLFSEQQAISEFSAAFDKSVKDRLISDVPLGVFLSGGLDSGAIVAVMSKYATEPIKTFTAGFGTENDEFVFAKRIADKFGTDHSEVVIDFNDFTKYFPQIVWHLDEPVADPAIFPTFFVSALAKKRATVALLGEGSDELFAGYSRYANFGGVNRFLPQKLKAKMYFNMDVAFRGGEKNKVYSEKLKAKNSGLFEKFYEDFFSQKKGEFVNKALEFDISHSLPNYQLMRVDKLSMAHSLEARAPFLSQEVVEVAEKTALSLKIHRNAGKFIVRKHFQEMLPKEMFYEKKRIFSVPIRQWFDSGFEEIAKQLLEKKTIEKRGFFDYSVIENLFRKRKGLFASRSSNQLWMIAMLELWQRMFIDQEKMPQNFVQLKKFM